MKIFTYRYMWKIKDSDRICFKIITDTKSGLEQFEQALLQLPDIVSALKEYISEIDCDLVGIVDTILGGK